MKIKIYLILTVIIFLFASISSCKSSKQCASYDDVEKHQIEMKLQK
jgi:hypothetical protein